MHHHGLSFKGGSARGLGSIGFIRMIQEAGLKSTVVAGSSSGAMVASMYALGFSWTEMVEAVKHIQLWKLASIGNFLSKGTLVPEHNFKQAVMQVIGRNMNIEDLPTKLVIFASEIKSRQRVILDSGDLVDAIAATCAVPYILPSVTINHHRLADGDLTSSFSANVLRSHGATKVIGVGHKMYPTHRDFGKGLGKAVDVFRYIGGQLEIEHDEDNPVDFEFRYQAEDHAYFNFKEIDKLVERTYRHACLDREHIISVLDQ
jgi:NTE family protein